MSRLSDVEEIEGCDTIGWNITDSLSSHFTLLASDPELFFHFESDYKGPPDSKEAKLQFQKEETSKEIFRLMSTTLPERVKTIVIQCAEYDDEIVVPDVQFTSDEPISLWTLLNELDRHYRQHPELVWLDEEYGTEIAAKHGLAKQRFCHDHVYFEGVLYKEKNASTWSIIPRLGS